ncbi:carotenoid 1,2-hydratase [Vibrio sp. SCSIO 43132]|uniref:lipocalin-like domain-containing protein n=1 Tax=Vibrio sp. SCSIO 43132 TaxID=2779363 RepID=UPI001CA921DE|nr:lipocalin-like domain-containing protein [Vibrio sp. SCSIO 43132]UAB72505.1 carotenoid 1,2-hydratase [Vibrio sp. SCSIO 43132]
MRTWLKAASISVVLLFLMGCEDKPQQGMGSWLGEQNHQFAEVTEGVEIKLPDDHRAHPDFRLEWWYFTANLEDNLGNPLGIQWTQFRIAVSPLEQAEKSSWSSNQIYMAHSAVTTSDSHLADEKWSRGHSQLSGVEATPLRVFLDDWQWKSSTRDLFPASLNVKSDRFEYSLTLTSNSPYQKQGKNGYSQKDKNGEVASYYYSQPFIQVDGEVVIDGEIRKVAGKGWIDREWSSQFLLGSQQGWDWFALRLSEDTSLVVFQLRDSESGNTSYAHAKMMNKDGSGKTIDQEQITLRATSQTVIDGRSYPTEWQIQIPDHKINLTVSALNPSAKMPLTIPYWEGPVQFSGSHSGSGYMELTGY